MQKKIGPYLYFDGFRKEKTFGDRSFQVVIAAAYDAGIIGPEHNGIAILDDNNSCVVLDQHKKESSGYFGPSAEQKAEFERVMSYDWADFSHFVATHPRYRGGIADIDSASPDPDAGDLLDLWITKGKVPNPSGPDIRTPAMIDLHADENSTYTFPDKTREEMIVALANHKSYHPMNYNNGGFVVSWDIKVRGRVDGNVDGYDHDSKFDTKWEEFLQNDDGATFHEACEDALRQYEDGDFIAAGDESVTAKFYTNGRSGGHLVLAEWNGRSPRGWASCPMAFDDRHDYIGWLKELDNDDLVKFYTLVKTVDADTSDPTASVNHGMAFIRQNKEEEWSSELSLTP